jgi:hypothetical protein
MERLKAQSKAKDQTIKTLQQALTSCDASAGNGSGDRGAYAGGRGAYAGDRGAYAGGRGAYAGRGRGRGRGRVTSYGGQGMPEAELARVAKFLWLKWMLWLNQT